ncbi:putative cytochrome P450 12c1, mitochondrial [Haematobia irritans]|uniref:putative cytochrome P450 12c1, mitochondrial n=1 Tax=Haematobia irritans TaxID=7368 RepID=UPI003F503968
MFSKIIRKPNCNLDNIWNHRKFSTAFGIKTAPATLEEKSYVSDLQKEWQKSKPFKSVPGPTKLQMIRGFMRNGDFHDRAFDDVLQIFRQRYGDIFLIPGMFGQNTNLVTFNLNDHEKVFRTEGPYPYRPGNELALDYRLARKDDLYDEDNLGVAGNGPQWGKIRHAVNPILMKPRNTVLYIDPMQKVNEEFIERIQKIRDPITLEVPGNFLTEIKRLSFESVAVIALDKHFGLVRNDASVPEAQELFDNFQIFSKSMYDLGIKPSIYRYFKTPTYKRFERSMDTITDICRKFVDETLQRIEGQGFRGEGKSVLEQLIKIDRKIAIIMAVDMLIAGADTTSTIMSGALLCLAKNPEKQQKLREEILTHVGRAGKFTMENMKNLPYLRAFIKESIRMYPLIFGNMRSTGMDLSLGGYQIPKHTHVIMASNLLLQDEKYFNRPKEFLPERWLRSGDADPADGASIKSSNPFIFLPFGFGPRSCIGKRVVDLELEITLANIVRNFHMEYNHPTENAFKTYFMSQCVIPLNFKFIDLKC